jgi:CRISPR-associated endonuclease/helicase Cas3
VLALAARLHDEGKRAPRWQEAFRAPNTGGPYAKTRGPIRQGRLEGYRHEFGSLPYAEAHPALNQLAEEQRDLVLHLIAAHHGYARPLIPVIGCDDAPPRKLQERAREVTLRFARLQRRWGPWGLAWWEALLRAADQQASRENEERGRKPHRGA